MNYKEWESLKTGDRVKRFMKCTGTIVASCGIGHVVKFDSGVTKRIMDGNLNKIVSRKKGVMVIQ